MKTFSDLVKYAYLFANDLKNIYWHAIGDKFDIIRNISNELYKEASAEIDDFAEIAISINEVVESFNKLNNLEDWHSATDTAYDWDKFVSFLSTSGLRYLEILQDVETDNSGYKSLLDSYVAFWSKEINYKNSNRAIENPKEDTIPIKSEEESKIKDNSDAFIGIDNSDYSDIYLEKDEDNSEDSEDFADMTKVYDNNDKTDESTWEDMVLENGDLINDVLPKDEDINNKAESEDKKSKSNLTQISNDMIISSGEEVTPSYNFEM